MLFRWAFPERLAKLPARLPLGLSLLAGVRTIFRHPELRLLVGAFGVDMLVQAMVDVLIVIAAISLLDIGPQGAGWLSAGWGSGDLRGAWPQARCWQGDVSRRN